MQARGVRNLWHLAHAEPEVRRLILREGGLEASLAAMRMHGDNPEVQAHTLRLIWKVPQHACWGPLPCQASGRACLAAVAPHVCSPEPEHSCFKKHHMVLIFILYNQVSQAHEPITDVTLAPPSCPVLAAIRLRGTNQKRRAKWSSSAVCRCSWARL